MVSPIKVLVCDDDPDARDLILHQLDGDRFKLTMKESCEEVLALLNKRPDKFDVVLLDYYIPGGMSGLDCLKEMKANIHLSDLPVILQTQEKDSENVIEALNEGAFYFLEKTTKRDVICSVVLSAMESSIRYRNLELQRAKLTNSLQFIEEARFRIRTLEDMEILTALLASSYPEPDQVTIGIHELLTNAIEHGNLDITYDAKSKLILTDLWKAEVDARLSMDEHRFKTVEVCLQKTTEEIILTIKDQGKGFNAGEYMTFEPERLFEAHGRGIAVARHMSFDTVEYLGPGNEVRATVFLNREKITTDQAS